MESYLRDILPSKLRLDQLYVRYRSFWTDLDVLFFTFLVLLPTARSYTPVEKRLFLGPIQKLMRRFVNWFTLDWAVTLLAIAAAGLFWRSFGPLNLGWRVAILLALGFSLLFSLVNAILRVNRIEWSRASATDALDLLPGAGLAMLIALLINQYYPSSLIEMLYGGEIPSWVTRPLMPPGLIGMATSLAFLGFLILRYRSRLITGLASRWLSWRSTVSAAQERVLIIGGGETGQYASWMLSNGRFASSFKIVGFVDDDLYKQGARIHGIEVLGPSSDIVPLVAKHDIGIIIFAIHNISPEKQRQLLNVCSSTSARVFMFPDIPAALSVITKKGRQSGYPIKDIAGWQAEQILETPEELPCHLCLIKTTPIKVDRWLAHLEEIASRGDLGQVQAEIQALRGLVQDDVAIQQATILVEEDK